MLTTEDVDPRRVINVCGNTRKAHAPEIACLEHVEAALTSTELKEIKKNSGSGNRHPTQETQTWARLSAQVGYKETPITPR